MVVHPSLIFLSIKTLIFYYLSTISTVPCYSFNQSQKLSAVHKLTTLSVCAKEVYTL